MKVKRIFDIAYEIGLEGNININEEPYTFAVAVADKAVRLHVKAALLAANNAARIINDPRSYCGNTGSEYPPDQIIDREAILNCYPLDKNI